MLRTILCALALLVSAPAVAQSPALSNAAKLRDIVTIKDPAFAGGAKCDGVTDDSAARDAALATGHRVYIPEGNCKFTTTTTLSGGKRLFGDGGVSSKTLITYTGTGVAVSVTGSYNGIEGIKIVAASATDALKLTDASQNFFRDIKITGPATRGIYMTSASVVLGTAWNTFQNFEVNSAVTALQMDQTGAGFVNLNTFISGLLRTSATSNGTVVTLTTSNENTFIDVDASNYGTGTVKSWNIAGTSNTNKWIGGLIDTPTGTLTGFTFAAGTSSNKVFGMINVATTPYSSTATPITDMSKEAYLDNNGNFFGEIRLNTPAFATAGPGVNFYDTGNNGNQFMYGLSGQICIGLTKATCKISFNPSTGAIVGGSFRGPAIAKTLANGLNSDIALTSGAFAFAEVTGPTAGFSVGGFTNPAEGTIIYLNNTVAQVMTIVNEDASSTATNRIRTMTGGNVALRAGTSFASFIYSSSIGRWMLMSTN